MIVFEPIIHCHAPRFAPAMVGIASTQLPLLDRCKGKKMARANLLARRGGGIGSIVGWFIRIVIYDICITGISDVLHVSRMVALFIFLGILAVIAFVGYLLKQKMSPGFEED